MTSIVLIGVATFLYLGYIYFTNNWIKTDESLEFKRSNVFSSFISLYGVLCLIYKFDKELYHFKNVLVHYLFTVVGILLTFEVLFTILWGKIEHLMLDKIPPLLNKALHKSGFSFQLTDHPFVIILWVISILFAKFACNSDKILEEFLKSLQEHQVTDSHSSKISDFNSESTDDDIETFHTADIHHGDREFSETNIIYHEVPVDFGEVNTLSSILISPLPRRYPRRRGRTSVCSSHQ